MDSTRTKERSLPPGYQLGEFDIERVLGSGGFGITYLATDSSLNRKVVIKENLPVFAFRNTETFEVHPNSGSDDDVELFEWSVDNFLQEAQLLASFDHPCIVKVHRIFQSNGTAYFVMPYLGDWSFSSIIKDREKRGETFNEYELNLLVESLGDGLQCLHNSSVYHRDVKPANILVTDNWKPVLIDFGAARQQVGEKTLTVIESPGYTPFEQLESKGRIGPWSDIYGLAGTIYKAVTFQSPPKAADRLRDDPVGHLVDQYADSGNYGRKFLEAIVWGMRFDAGDRPQSVPEWLSGFQSGPENALFVSGNTSHSKPNATASDIAGLPQVSSVEHGDSTNPDLSSRSSANSRRRMRSRRAKRESSSLGNPFRIVSLLLGVVLLLSGLIFWITGSPSVEAKTEPEKLPIISDGTISREFGGSLDVTEDGNYLVTTSGSEILVFDLERKVVVSKVKSSVGKFKGVYFHHDGKRIIIGGSTGLEVIEWRSGTILEKRKIENLNNFCYARKAEQCFFVNTNRGVCRINVNDIDYETLILPTSKNLYNLVSSEDGALIAFHNGSSSKVEVWDLNKEEIVLSHKCSGGTRGLAISQDKQFVAIQYGGHGEWKKEDEWKVKIFRTEGGEQFSEFYSSFGVWEFQTRGDYLVISTVGWVWVYSYSDRKYVWKSDQHKFKDQLWTMIWYFTLSKDGTLIYGTKGKDGNLVVADWKHNSSTKIVAGKLK